MSTTRSRRGGRQRRRRRHGSSSRRRPGGGRWRAPAPLWWGQRTAARAHSAKYFLTMQVVVRRAGRRGGLRVRRPQRRQVRERGGGGRHTAAGLALPTAVWLTCPAIAAGAPAATATAAVRNGWAPTMVDLDIGQGSITAPGCIAATPGARGPRAWERLQLTPPRHTLLPSRAATRGCGANPTTPPILPAHSPQSRPLLACWVTGEVAGDAWYPP